MKLGINFTQTSLAELRRIFEPEIVLKADRTAITRTARKVRTQISRDVRQVYNVKARAIGQTVKLIERQRGPISSRLLLYVGKAIELSQFSPGRKRVSSARGPRWATTVRIRKDRGRRIVGKPAGFHGKGFYAAGHVMARRMAARRTHRKLFGPSIPQMVANEQDIQRYHETVRREYPIELERALTVFVAKAAA